MIKIDPILVKVGPAECLAVLAEEATELAQAALKLRRTMDSVKDRNPTNMTGNEAFCNLIEEIADVQNAWMVLLSPDLGRSIKDINATIERKYDRWAKRIGLELKEKHDEDEDEEEEE